MICPNCKYLFDPKRNAMTAEGERMLSRPMGAPLGCGVGVRCPRCNWCVMVERPKMPAELLAPACRST